MAQEVRRRLPQLLGAVALVVLLALLAAPALGQSPSSPPAPTPSTPSSPSADSSPGGSASADPAIEAEGAELFVASCAACHGREGAGTANGPPLTEVGPAAADFQLRTGRMPLADPDAQAVRKEPAFSADEIAALVAYVGSLGPGPQIPEVDESGTDLSLGQELFVANCAPCHGATGNGGAAGRNALAPSLYRSSPLDLAEAMITGPGEMPIFAFSEEELSDIAGFVSYLQTEDAPGGADIGGIGPVPEGFVAWMLGMGTLAAVSYLIGRKKPSPLSPGKTSSPHGPQDNESAGAP